MHQIQRLKTLTDILINENSGSKNIILPETKEELFYIVL